MNFRSWKQIQISFGNEKGIYIRNRVVGRNLARDPDRWTKLPVGAQSKTASQPDTTVPGDLAWRGPCAAGPAHGARHSVARARAGAARRGECGRAHATWRGRRRLDDVEMASTIPALGSPTHGALARQGGLGGGAPNQGGGVEERLKVAPAGPCTIGGGLGRRLYKEGRTGRCRRARSP
jgi:hypothetical protein